MTRLKLYYCGHNIQIYREDSNAGQNGIKREEEDD